MKDNVGAHGCMAVVVAFCAITVLIVFFAAIIFTGLGIIDVIAGLG